MDSQFFLKAQNRQHDGYTKDFPREFLTENHPLPCFCLHVGAVCATSCPNSSCGQITAILWEYLEGKAVPVLADPEGNEPGHLDLNL